MGTIKIAISNQKGGVGKTCSVTTIAGILSRKGFRVLAIDLDSQGNLSTSLLQNLPEDTIADTLNGGKLPIVKVTDRLDLVTCNTDINAVCQAMDSPDDRFILQKALKRIDGKYDFVIMDCPPHFDYITNNAYTAADYVFVPTQASKKSMEGISLLANACYLAGTPTRINGIFFTMYEPRTLITKKYEARIRDTYGSIVLKTQIRKCVKVDEAADEKMDVAEYCPSCTAAQDYLAVVDEILEIVTPKE